jgi:PQQ-dependent catabolism-associated CXXCW motif protein
MAPWGRARFAGSLIALAVAFAPMTTYAQAPDALAPPAQLSPHGLGEFQKFLRGDVNKAFAIPIGPSERLGWAAKRDTAFQGLLSAMFTCNRNTLSPCHGYAVNDTIIEASYAQFDRESAAALADIRGTSGWPPFAEEDRDFGVAATTTNFGAETPTRLAGAKTIATIELVARLKSEARPVLVDVLDEGEQHMTLPTAWWWRAAGNYPNDEAAGRLTGLLGALLSTAVPKRDTPIIFFCHSSRCWLSHNAALRAIAAGYTNVLWYRGGIEAWKAAGLPLLKAVLTAELW